MTGTNARSGSISNLPPAPVAPAASRRFSTRSLREYSPCAACSGFSFSVQLRVSSHQNSNRDTKLLETAVTQTK
jgi:hypothetical protein